MGRRSRKQRRYRKPKPPKPPAPPSHPELTPSSYLADPRPACPECGEPSDSVAPRTHPFVTEGWWWQDNPKLTSCLGCFDGWRMAV